MALQAHISPGGWAIGLLVAVVLRHSLTPSQSINWSISLLYNNDWGGYLHRNVCESWAVFTCFASAANRTPVVQSVVKHYKKKVYILVVRLYLVGGKLKNWYRRMSLLIAQSSAKSKIKMLTLLPTDENSRWCLRSHLYSLQVSENL
jgi:hypothetical protein